ncbi:MAG: YhcH/YjgK/YiaL family protein [Bacteroidota bacterium]
MILDKIENTHLYSGLSKRIETALKYLNETNFKELGNGTYDVVKGEIFAIVNRYDTIHESEEKLEAHKKYIDVQFVYEGNEMLGYLTKTDQVVFRDYDEEEDYELYNGKKNMIEFNQGMFAVFFPDDLHAPGIHIETSTRVTKIVVKVLI